MLVAKAVLPIDGLPAIIIKSDLCKPPNLSSKSFKPVVTPTTPSSFLYALDAISIVCLIASSNFINEELKELEIKILSSNSRIQEIELSEYELLIEKLNEFINDIKSNSNIISTIDCLLSFSKVSIDNNYVRPKIIDKVSIEIKNGRHPIIEKSLPIGERYIPKQYYP